MKNRRPIEVRPSRAVEGWMVAAVVLLIAVSVAVLTVTRIILPAFAQMNATLEAVSHPA